MIFAGGSRQIVGVCMALGVTACSLTPQSIVPAPATAPKAVMRFSSVDRLESRVRQVMREQLAEQQEALLTELAATPPAPADYKRRLVLDALHDPWQGFKQVENHALLIAELAEGGVDDLPALLDVAEATMDRTADFFQPVPYPSVSEQAEVAGFLEDVLAQSFQLRERALKNLGVEERQFLFAHAQSLMEEFTPHLGTITDQIVRQAERDHRFVQLVNQRLDSAALIASAQALVRLGTQRVLRQIWLAFQRTQALPTQPAGITGDVLYLRQTSYGLIVIGGPGPNTYNLDAQFALVIDLGGDDIYRGFIGSSAGVDQGNRVVIDLAGNDTYQGTTLGLATGRMGVGLVLDMEGNDLYQLAPGSGGAGFAGIGVLYDGAGNDVYLGSRFTQGTAMAGSGLLLDMGGHDRYTSDGFAVGFGGPLGFGGVLDIAGDDTYQCGDKYASAYNAAENPSAQPGDPAYQYDCFGIGVGAGRRVFSKKPELQELNLAGGWGLLVDLAGNDQQHSSNFSQGMGFYWGAGTVLDLDGDDLHRAARYGIGSGAHYGVGLFIDRHGEDTYDSTGPYYTVGTAWDHSAALAIDGGTGNDRYRLQRSTGLGVADYSSWALFVEEGGQEDYKAGQGLGSAGHGSLAGFFDLAGTDEYVLGDAAIPASKGAIRNNKRTILSPVGGLFIDQ